MLTISLNFTLRYFTQTSVSRNTSVTAKNKIPVTSRPPSEWANDGKKLLNGIFPSLMDVHFINAETSLLVL